MTTPAQGGSPFDRAAARTNAAKRQQDEKTKRQQEEADRKKQEQQRCSELEDELLLKISQFFGTEDDPGERLKLVQWLYDIVDGKIDDESRIAGDIILEALNSNPKATPAQREKLAYLAEGLGSRYDLLIGPRERIMIDYLDIPKQSERQRRKSTSQAETEAQRRETLPQTEEERAAKPAQKDRSEGEVQRDSEESQSPEPASSPLATPKSSTTEQDAQEAEEQHSDRNRWRRG